MKLSQNFFCLLLLVLVCIVAICLDTTEARRKNRRNKTVCKYARRGEEGECDPVTQMKEVTGRLKKGDPATCAATKVFKKPCTKRNKKVKGCKYDRKSSPWSACDEATGLKTKVMNLLESSTNDNCPATRTKTKRCGKNRKGGRRPKKGCVYLKEPWSECEIDRKIKQRVMVLVEGDPTLCLPKKIVTKKCKKACRFAKGDWGPCDPITNLKTRTLTPKGRSSSQCQRTFQTKSCKRRAELKGPKSSKCRYSFSEWSECDKRSNTMIQWMILKSGDPNICERSKKLSRKCKIACKFRKGQWSECDQKTQLMTRNDTLVKGDRSECDESRQITKKCKRECKFVFGDWGPCDPQTNNRSRVKKRIRGDPEKCVAEEVVTRPCKKKDGKERCFFGPWADFGPCQNGVIARNRPVLQGGVECERKAVITKACEKIR